MGVVAARGHLEQQVGVAAVVGEICHFVHAEKMSARGFLGGGIGEHVAGGRERTVCPRTNIARVSHAPKPSEQSAAARNASVAGGEDGFAS